MRKPSVIVFDVNETLSDMSALSERFTDLGLAASMAELWFATLLRDGFALTAAGDEAPFSVLAAESARRVVIAHGPAQDADAAVEHVISGMSGLRLHPDVVEGVRALRAAGLRLVTLSNGGTGLAERLVTDAGIRGEFDALLSVVGASLWKPAREAYEHAAATLQVPLADMLLVAVHPWDVHGAAKAGLRTAWLNRSGAAYPSYFTPPDCVIADLTALSNALAVG
jgi:2-haloacid dehalogenase